MNYYERHIGDYIRDTVSLTLLEDGAYTRLLDQYYQTERPLPSDKREVYRLARATSAAERKAVDYVLQRYFEATAEGYRQKRCDEVIEEFWERDQGKESKRENDRERQRRARERRAQLFDELRSHGVVPAFNTPTRELQTQLSRVTGRDESQNVTRDNTATQTPLPTPQTPEASKEKKTPRVAALSSSDLVADGVTEQTANEFLDLRRKKRSPLTSGAWAGIKAEALKAGWSMQAAVAKCVARGWQGFEAEWVLPKQTNGHRMSESDRRIAEFLGENRPTYPDDGMTIDMESIR